MTECRSNRNVYYACHYHVVWCPKYRRKVLVTPVDERLKTILHQVCQEHDVILEAIEVMPDHVHLLVNVDPQFGIHRLIRLMKGRSSRLLRQEFPKLKTRLPTLWTNSYLCVTEGRLTKEMMTCYIDSNPRGQ